jgi:hypothetical protein
VVEAAGQGRGMRDSARKRRERGGKVVEKNKKKISTSVQHKKRITGKETYPLSLDYPPLPPG